MPDEYQALIEAMAQSCMERGYTDTTIQHLLAETGLDRSEFDRHFPDKEACAIAAVDSILGEGLATVAGAFSGDISEGEIALEALLSLMELFAERPAMGSLAMTDSRQRLPRAGYERYEGGFAILIAMLDRLRSDCNTGFEPPPCAALAAVGGPAAVIRRELAHGNAADLPKLLPDLIYSAIVPFLGQPEALRLARHAQALIS